MRFCKSTSLPKPKGLIWSCMVELKIKFKLLFRNFVLFLIWTFITKQVMCAVFWGEHSVSVICENVGASTSDTADGCNLSFCCLIQLRDKYLCINNINMKFKPICGFTGSSEIASNICWNI